MSNYCMNPVEIFEIDDPDDTNRRNQKETAQIAPSMS